MEFFSAGVQNILKTKISHHDSNTKAQQWEGYPLAHNFLFLKILQVTGILQSVANATCLTMDGVRGDVDVAVANTLNFGLTDIPTETNN